MCTAAAWLRRVRIATAVALLGAAAAQAEGRVYASPKEVEPLAAGARVPSVQVTSVSGERVDLREVVRDHGALLVFYRGGW